MAEVTPIQAVRHAWAAVREAADSGSREVDDEQLDSIEPGIRLLELSAAYRAAHAAYNEALTAALKGQCSPLVSATTWRRLEDEQKAAESAMNAAREALLSAALAVGPRATDDADRDPCPPPKP